MGRVKAGPGQMEPVFINLAVIARDAMPLGGTLSIETAPGQLDDVFARSHPSVVAGSHVMLVVSDTGECGADSPLRI